MKLENFRSDRFIPSPQEYVASPDDFEYLRITPQRKIHRLIAREGVGVFPLRSLVSIAPESNHNAGNLGVVMNFQELLHEVSYGRAGIDRQDIKPFYIASGVTSSRGLEAVGIVAAIHHSKPGWVGFNREELPAFKGHELDMPHLREIINSASSCR